MVLTRKDFIEQVKIIRQIKNKRDRERVTNSFITLNEKSNPHFDETKFRSAITKSIPSGIELSNEEKRRIKMLR